MSIKYYRDLLRQAPRIEAFQRAITTLVAPGDRVLEVGTGLGTFAFFAADAGAGQVWAVETEPIVHVAETIAKLNGYDGRIEFIRGSVPGIELPERADILIFEDFPVRLVDARTLRFLKCVHRDYLRPGAKVLPCRGRTFLAPVSSEELMDQVTTIGNADDNAYGVDWDCSREYLANTPLHLNVAKEALVGDPQETGEVRFDGLIPEIEPSAEVNWIMSRDVEIHGLAYWFDLELVEGQWLSNAPGETPATWAQLFLPIDPFIKVRAGTTVRASAGPQFSADRVPRFLQWQVSAGGVEVGGNEFLSAPASLSDLYAASPDARPHLSVQGRLQARVLQLTDGARSVSEIAEALCKGGAGLSQVDAERLVVEALSGRLERVQLSDLSTKE